MNNDSLLLLSAKDAYQKSLKNENLKDEYELKNLIDNINEKIDSGFFELRIKSISINNIKKLRNLNYTVKTYNEGISINWNLK